MQNAAKAVTFAAEVVGNDLPVITTLPEKFIPEKSTGTHLDRNDTH